MLYLILALVFYTAAILVGTSAARNANTNIVSALGNIISVIIPLIVAVPAVTKKTWVQQKYGLQMAVLGGILISLFVLALNKSFTQNKVGVVTPVVYGGAILFSTILSVFIYKEKISLLEGIGLGLVLLGLGVVLYARATA